MLSFHTAMAIEDYRVCFGVFEVDRRARELRKHGVRIRLEDQPFEVLAALLERPGEVVTRGELQARIWPDGTFVDFDKSLTKAINKVRTALGDSADNPRFIETLSRRGYRFIAPVTVTAAPEAKPGEPATPAPAAETPAAPDEEAPGRRALTKLWWLPALAGGAVILLAVALFTFNAVGMRERLLARFGADQITSIVVLPLENLSRNPDEDFFAEGLTDELITDLGRLTTLRVISRTTAMHYGKGKKTLPEIAKELGVDAAVEGTVLHSGGRVRISAQLVRTRKEGHLWADTYTRDASDVIALEREMALSIAREVSRNLAFDREARLARGKTANLNARELYLRGRALFDQRTEDKTTQAVGYFEQALREDPRFALAYSGLADCYSTGWWNKGDIVRAEGYARKALAIEPDLAEAHASLGEIFTNLQRPDEADRELKRAIELDSNYAPSCHWLAALRIYQGRLQEAVAWNAKARQLDPFSLPPSFAGTLIFIDVHQYDQAIQQAQRVAALAPSPRFAHYLLARIYWLQGRVANAVEEEKALESNSNDPALLREWDDVAATYARSGLHTALIQAARLKEQRHKRPYGTISIAWQYGVLGDKQKVLEWLEREVQEREGAGGWINAGHSPEFECARGDPRFHAAMRRLGLEQ
ncbi:MAG: tetratricopeptide repeat protein [Bryobacteraceae bacterium]